MTLRTHLRRATLALAGGGGLVALGLLLGPVGSASAAPVGIDLYAENGTTDLPGSGGTGLPVLGYCTTDPCVVTAPGGPVIRVAVGSDVTITLHNGLADESTSLYVGGQAMVPDTTAVAAGGTRAYTFTATRPGTYLYEAGITAGSQHQVARGLYGALVVEPETAGQAYDGSTAFDSESLLVLSEVDPKLNTSATPATFDMRAFAPKWTLVNGKPGPGTAPVTVGSGTSVLLRYVNAGTMYHSMAVLGADQRIVAYDGSQLVNGTTDISRRYVAETFGPGQTADAIVTVPTTAAERRLAVYDAGLTLHNTNAPGTAGMLALLKVTGTGTGTDVTGPATKGVAWANDALAATVDASALPGASVGGAEYFVDAVGAGGTGTALVAKDGTFDGTTEAVAPSATDADALRSLLATGQHVVYVHGLSGGAWGPFSSVLVTGSDAVGPTTSGVTVAPDHTNGSAALALTATGDDSASGNSVITAFDWAIDGGSATTADIADGTPVTGLETTIPTSALTGLTEGPHTVAVRSRDAGGNWSATAATAGFVVDRTAPVVTIPPDAVTPNPNNGNLPVNGTNAAVRVSATIDDTVSGIVKARATLDTGTTVIPMEASDGAFNEPSEEVYLDIPLATVKQLSEGDHQIHISGLDAAGNWSEVRDATLTVDRTGPVVSGLSLSPNPTNGATEVSLTGTATDPAGVGRVEWFIGADPGTGQASAATVHPDGTFSATITVTSAMDLGDYTVVVRALDTIGNRSAANATTVLHLTPLLWFSTSGNDNPPGVGGSADDADVYHYTGARFGRTVDAGNSPYGLPSGGRPGNVNVDGFSRVDADHFYVSFNGSATVAGIQVQVQDEDVLYWNAGHWELWFDGSAHGLGGGNNNTGFDLDAISVVGTTLYFSTDNNANPMSPGSTTGDDADIYSWNGATYARVVDATAVAGFSTSAGGTANVDGFVWRSATDWLMSFSADTSITGLGAVQDEDVIRLTGSTWSTYFDGTPYLTSNSQDVDAFDIP